MYPVPHFDESCIRLCNNDRKVRHFCVEGPMNLSIHLYTAVLYFCPATNVHRFWVFGAALPLTRIGAEWCVTHM